MRSWLAWLPGGGEVKYLVAALLLLPVAAFTYNWDYWQDRCTDDLYTDFLIYGSNASYRASSGILIVQVEPGVDFLEYLPSYSTASFAGYERPLIPGFDYPSTLPLRSSVNYSFFIPFGYSENDFSMRVVANGSDGLPRCSQLEWEVNDSKRVEDTSLDVQGNVVFDPISGRFLYNISSAEEVRVYFSVFSDSELFESSYAVVSPDEPVSKSSKLRYDSFDVASGLYTVYLVAYTDDASFFKEFKLFEFFDFDLELPQVPDFRPGESYTATLVLKNTGYLSDSYDVSVDAPIGWEYSITDPGSLDRGQDRELSLSYTVPELQVGSAAIHMNVSSRFSNITKSYSIELSPEKLSTMDVSIRDIQNIQAYGRNNLSVVAVASGTVSPRLYYYVFTEPALLIRDGFGSMPVRIGEINKATVSFDVGGSCAMSEADSMAFNAGRKLLMLGNAVYYLSSEMSNETVATLQKFGDLVEGEKLKMTSESASKLFTSADRLSLIIDRLIEGWQDQRGVEYFRSLREDLYLYNVDLDGLLEDVGERMSESCSSVDTVELHLFSMDTETLQQKDVPKTLPVTGPKVIEFIGPSELKAISGSSVFVTYKLKNNAGESFEADLEPSTDVIYVPSFVYLPADSTKEVEVRVRPPEYFEAEELQAFIEIKTRTYNLRFPITLEIGNFDPEIVADSEYAVSPGSENYFNITLRTGGMDDTFRLSVEAPSWVEVPERVATEGGEATITLKVAPPSSTSGSEYVTLTAYSESFPDYVAKKSFDIFVSSEANTLLDRIVEDEGLLEDRKERLDEKSYIDARRYLRAAREAVAQNEMSQAKLELRRAENIIFSVSEGEGGGIGVYVIIALLVGVFGVVFWKFLLPKIKGTPEAAPEEEVI